MNTLMIFEKCIICLISIIISSVNSVCAAYNDYLIESDRLCTMGLRPKVIEIGKYEKSAAIVKEIQYFDSLSGKYSFNCKFKVKSTQETGLFAVIQKMNLRKNATTGECIDYVQFRHSNAFQFGIVDINLEKHSTPWTEKHCGYANAMEVDLHSLDLTDPAQVLPHSYTDSQGKIDVEIHIANETIKYGTELDLVIVFTSYSVCHNDLGSKFKKCGADACIWHQYFNDGYLNCPFPTCTDEGGCKFYYEAGIRPSAGLATKVMVGAVAGVFTMFVVFVTFLWIFRHCSLCLGDSQSNCQNTTQMRPVPTIEDVQPTAPPRSPSIDKDLPPSYESLFPNA